MSNWYDGLTDVEIQYLKDNTQAYCFCAGWMQDALRECTADNALQYITNNGWFTASKIDFKGYTYRLSPSWQRSAKQGRWEYCDIIKNHNGLEWEFVRYEHTMGLYRAFNQVGFGGIEFEEWPDRWFWKLVGKTTDGRVVDVSQIEEAKPATPKRVRFWIND